MCLKGVDLDHVHEPEHALKAAVRLSVRVGVVEDVADVGMILLHQLVAATVPKSQPANLHLWVRVGSRRAAVLPAGFEN